MSELVPPSIDVESLLKPVPGDQPSGPNLEYDAEYRKALSLAAGAPEQRMGNSVIAAVEPDWKGVRLRCLDLLTKTKDLRLSLYLTLSLMHTDGLRGMRDGLKVLEGIIANFWETLHPNLDASDNNDPTERANILASLSPPPGAFADPMRFRDRVRELTLATSPKVGKLTLRDIQMATGEVPPPASAPPDFKPLDVAQVEGAFDDAPVESLQASAELLAEASASTTNVERLFDERVGTSQGVSLAEFRKVLDRARQEVAKRLERRAPTGTVAGTGTDAAAGVDSASGGAPAASGAIRNSNDVIAAIDRICDYYERNEPSSPIPLLLRRAQRLVAKSFIDVVKDLNPQALQQIDMIFGTTSKS